MYQQTFDTGNRLKSGVAAACLLAGLGFAALTASCDGQAQEPRTGTAPPRATTTGGSSETSAGRATAGSAKPPPVIIGDLLPPPGSGSGRTTPGRTTSGQTTSGQTTESGSTTGTSTTTTAGAATTPTGVRVSAIALPRPITPPGGEFSAPAAGGGPARRHHHRASRPNRIRDGAVESIGRHPNIVGQPPGAVSPPENPDVSAPSSGLDGDFGDLAHAWRNLPTAQVTDTIKTIPAETWRVGDRVTVSVAVAQKLTDQLKEKIAGPKASELPVTPLKISPTMTAELTDDSPTSMFQIDPAGAQELPVYYDPAHPGSLPPTVWEWGVTPLHAGPGVLKITVKAILRVGSLNQVQPVTSYQRQVRVHINLVPGVVQRIRKVSDDVIAAVTAAVAAAIAAAIVTWLRHLFHKKKKATGKK